MHATVPFVTGGMSYIINEGQICPHQSELAQSRPFCDQSPSLHVNLVDSVRIRFLASKYE